MSAGVAALIASTGEPRVQLSAANPNTTTVGGTANAIFSLLTTGIATASQDVDQTWIIPAANTGNYEARLTVVSGVTPTGSAVGSWVNLGSAVSWTVSRSTVGPSAATTTVEIRKVSDPAVILASATVTFTATREL